MKTKLLLIFMFFVCCHSMYSQCWSSISNGESHTVAIRTDGTLWAWGLNGSGQLGNPSVNFRITIPVQIGDATNWIAISAGKNFTIALKENGTLWSWGYNNDGQLGDGTIISKSEPVQIGTDTDWATIATRNRHTVALKNNGSLWAWGFNSHGQLGNATLISSSTPQQIGTDLNWNKISVGNYYTVAIKTNGTLWTWGNNNVGQLGDGTTINKSSPTKIGTASDWDTITAGERHTSAIKTNGTLWTWGHNAFGQLGDGTTTNRHTPIRIGTAADWKTVSSGNMHTIALKTNGLLWGWGDNGLGQTGQGTSPSYNYNPNPIGATYFNNNLFVSAGAWHNSTIKTDGTLWTFGNNDYGELGDGTETIKYAPTLVDCSVLNLEDFVDNNLFKLYPNPVTNFLTVYVNSQNIDKITIFDVTGKIIIETTESSMPIDVHTLTNGVYVIEVLSKNYRHQKKFIKQ